MRTTFGQTVAFLAWACIFAGFGYLIYLTFGWLLFGPGVGLLLLGTLAGVIYLIFGWLPNAMSKWSGEPKWQAERTIKDFVLITVGIVLGCFWIPKQFDLNPAWYWRVVLGFAMVAIGLITRR